MIGSITMKSARVFAIGLVTSAVVAISCGSANATVLAEWTFEVSQPTTAGPHTAEGGVYAATSTALGSHASGTTVYSSPSGNGSAHSFSSNFWAIGDYYQLSTSSVGYQDIMISWDQVSSSTGPKDFELFYSSGGPFTSAGTYTVLPNSAGAPGAGVWNGTTAIPAYSYAVDLSAITSLDNAASIDFRLVMVTDADANPPGTVGTAGTDRIDNFGVSGNLTAIPLPSAVIVFAGVAAIGGIARRRVTRLLA
jgi:hypothetical protein